jgi:hypothetical protein
LQGLPLNPLFSEERIGQDLGAFVVAIPTLLTKTGRLAVAASLQASASRRIDDATALSA